MANEYDVVVIGGGHNGLTTATSLAKKGKKVVLVEKRPLLGGLAAGEEFHPGYRTNGLLHDTGAVRQNVVDDLDLHKYGLKTTKERSTLKLLSKDSKSICVSSSLDDTVAEISKYSSNDADSYSRYREFVDKICNFLFPILNHAPSNLMNLGVVDIFNWIQKAIQVKKLGKKTMMEFLKVAPMSVADFLDEYFETDFLKAGLAGPAIYGSFNGPMSSYTTFNLLLWESCCRNHVIGGPQALVEALVAAAQSYGVDIRTGAQAERIVLNHQGKVKGVRLANDEEIFSTKVAASCSPYETFMNLLAPDEIPYSLERNICNYRSRGTTAKVNLAVSQPSTFNTGDKREVEFVRTCESLLSMEKAFDPVKYRRMTTKPILDIHIPTLSNPNLAPKGHSVISILVHYTTYDLHDGWTEGEKQKLGNYVLQVLDDHGVQLSNSIVHKEILSPADLEKRYSLPSGHIFHGEHAVDQMITRPIPSCATYDTPIPGLFLCGSGSHPGGGITCAPGSLAAKRILRHSA